MVHLQMVPYFFFSSLPPSLPPFLPPSLPVSLPPCRIILVAYHQDIVSLLITYSLTHTLIILQSLVYY